MIDAKVQHGIAIIPEKEKEIIVELEHAVNLEQAFIVPGGSIYGHDSGASHSNGWDARIALVDSTHLSIKRAYPSMYKAEVAWQVVYWGEPEQEQEPEPEVEIDWENDIDWRCVPIDAKVSVSEDGKLWCERYFCAYVQNNGYIAFSNGFSSEDAINVNMWKYCKLVNTEDVEKYKKVQP